MVRLKFLEKMRKSKTENFSRFLNGTKFFILFMSVCVSTLYANASNSLNKIDIVEKVAQ